MISDLCVDKLQRIARRGPVIMLIAVVTAGCTGIGPSTIPRDRSDYIDSVSASWKRQTLLNIVKLRYADTPVFLEVAQIVSGYTLQSTLEASAGTANFSDSLRLGAEGTFTDRPTVTYSPLTGESFVRKLLSPIPPSAVLSLVQSGWSADLVIRTCVQAINGHRNQSGAGARESPADKDFYLLIQLLREIQQSGAFGMRFEGRNDDDKDTTVLFFYHELLDPNVAIMIASLKELLGLNPGENRFKIAYGAIPSGDGEIAILTRSAIQIMIEIASYIEVPEQHLSESRTLPTVALAVDEEAEIDPLIRIVSGPSKPADSFVAVEYQDYWFWVDDADFESKKVFSFLMLLLMLSETGQGGKLPVLTIPAG